MGELAKPRLTRNQFYEWVVSQDARYELVDGQPVMMAGANRRHDRVAGNTFRLIANHLQGRRCQPFTSDTYIGPTGTRANQTWASIAAHSSRLHWRRRSLCWWWKYSRRQPAAST